MSLPTVFDLCTPRSDVLDGNIRESDFAADLAQVLRGDAPEEYRVPARFFANTHPTRGLRSLLRNVLLRLGGNGGEVAPIFRLDTQYGGGKTHALIALAHAARGMQGVENVGEFVDPALVPQKAVRIAMFDGENADPANGRPLESGLRARTPWGELAYQLGGRGAFEEIRRSDEEGVSPGAETLRALFGKTPTLLLLDELSVYLRKARRGSRAAEQLTAFLTSLFKAVEGTPDAALVFTLAIGKEGKATDAYAEENDQIAGWFVEAESVAARKATVLDPTSEEETAQVLRRRLFARIDDARVPEVVEAYRSLWTRERDNLPPQKVREDRAEELQRGYPLYDGARLETFERLAALFRATERLFGEMPEAHAARLVGGAFTARKILRALRDRASLGRRNLRERAEALKLLRSYTPVSELVSRHTRQTLRAYHREGKLDARVADRDVKDREVTLSGAERAVYEAVEDYISTTYQSAASDQRNAVGFVMTIYRRRLASSFHALRKTLEQRRRALGSQDVLALTDEDASDDETSDDAMDADEATALGRRALAVEERGRIDLLLDAVRRLPEDSKLHDLREVLRLLDAEGRRQVMVFTQYTDTMDFLRDRLTRDGRRVLCFSGRGGERVASGGGWATVSREETKRVFRQGEADLLLCTDAAAEGLNFQFCGALVNYDMPWNPMRVEQRIGRIDRLGQRFDAVRVFNLHYANTVETDVYLALRSRISLFERVVGRLQPILARLPRSLADVALSPSVSRTQAQESLVTRLRSEVDAAEQQRGFDLDAVIRSSELLPAGVRVRPLREREYAWQAPGMPEEVRVTTDPKYYEQHPESIELWSPGSSTFPIGEVPLLPEDAPERLVSLRSVFGRSTRTTGQ